MRADTFIQCVRRFCLSSFFLYPVPIFPISPDYPLFTFSFSHSTPVGLFILLLALLLIPFYTVFTIFFLFLFDFLFAPLLVPLFLIPYPIFSVPPIPSLRPLLYFPLIVCLFPPLFSNFLPLYLVHHYHYLS